MERKVRQDFIVESQDLILSSLVERRQFHHESILTSITVSQIEIMERLKKGKVLDWYEETQERIQGRGNKEDCRLVRNETY